MIDLRLEVISIRQWNCRSTVKPSASVNIVDTVGAGDAFATIFLLGLYKQWSIETILNRAQIFAGELISRRGATISDSDFYRAFSQEWNEL